MLEELCEARGHAERADMIADHDERTGRAVDLLSALTGLAMAASAGGGCAAGARGLALADDRGARWL